MSKTEATAAVIGCGRVGALTDQTSGNTLPIYFPINHCAAIRSTPGLRLAAVCDLNLQMAERAAALHNVDKIYADYQQMILEEKPDIVSIATRMSGRTDVIEFAVKHGIKALHIEKPLATNLADARRAVDAIRSEGAAISFGTIRRYMAVYRQAKQLLKSGRFGRLVQVIVDFGKSQLFWTHPHSVDLIDFFADCDEVDYVQSTFTGGQEEVTGNELDLDPVLEFGFVRYKDGVSGLITSVPGHHLKLVCDHGEISVLSAGTILQVAAAGMSPEFVDVEAGPSGRQVAMAELAAFISDGAPTTFSPSDLWRQQQILLALGLAGHCGRRVKLPDVSEDFTITGKFKGLYP